MKHGRLIVSFALLFTLALSPEAAFSFGAKPQDPPPTAPKPTPKPEPKPTPVPAPKPSLTVENLQNNQSFTEDDSALFYILATEVDGVEVSRNGKVLGLAEYRADEKKYRFNVTFPDHGAFDLKFAGKKAGKEVIAKSFRVNVVPKVAPPPVTDRNFNGYILKAVEKIRREHGLLGYNIKAQLTHDLDYNGHGILKSTYGTLTMCVSATLEIILTAYEIYAQETGDRSVYKYLPFKAWNSLTTSGIKARIWVDPKLNAYGTADALAHFGMGEVVPFSELEPGAFVNLNRTTKTGHSVVFIAYIDKNAKELPRYDAAKVAGFKYFSAQGKEARGQGGFDYRYAFFAKNGCPTIPYKRDCNVMWSTSRKYLNTGMMFHPKDWRMPASVESARAMVAPLTAEDLELEGRPAQFDGMTTDD